MRQPGSGQLCRRTMPGLCVQCAKSAVNASACKRGLTVQNSASVAISNGVGPIPAWLGELAQSRPFMDFAHSCAKRACNSLGQNAPSVLWTLQRVTCAKTRNAVYADARPGWGDRAQVARKVISGGP